jgi:hypothetical protein
MARIRPLCHKRSDFASYIIYGTALVQWLGEPAAANDPRNEPQSKALLRTTRHYLASQAALIFRLLIGVAVIVAMRLLLHSC